jgi:rare lipoprotein A (peptidoglycan hydrolase)
MTTSFYKGMTGHHLLVTNLSNGKQVTVAIIGSGPFNGPLMDMGTEPFQAIGGRLSDGFIPQVSVQLLD